MKQGVELQLLFVTQQFMPTSITHVAYQKLKGKFTEKYSLSRPD